MRHDTQVAATEEEKQTHKCEKPPRYGKPEGGDGEPDDAMFMNYYLPPTSKRHDTPFAHAHGAHPHTAHCLCHTAHSSLFLFIFLRAHRRTKHAPRKRKCAIDAVWGRGHVWGTFFLGVPSVEPYMRQPAQLSRATTLPWPHPGSVARDHVCSLTAGRFLEPI